MVKKRLFLTLEKEKKERLMNIAENKGTTATELVRCKVDEILNTQDENIKNNVRKIVSDLRQPFIYFKHKKAERLKEKASREKIAEILERVFNL